MNRSSLLTQTGRITVELARLCQAVSDPMAGRAVGHSASRLVRGSPRRTLAHQVVNYLIAPALLVRIGHQGPFQRPQSLERVFRLFFSNVF